MVQYIYFVKCPNCEDEHFDFFDDAKEFAMSCLTKKPIITQIEVDRNDFGECVDSCDLGTVWSWEDVMSDVPAEPEATVFSKADTFGCVDCDTCSHANCEAEDDLEFATLDNSVDFEPEISEVTADKLTESSVNKFVIVGETEDYSRQFYNTESGKWVTSSDDATLFDTRNSAIEVLHDLDKSDFYTIRIMIKLVPAVEGILDNFRKPIPEGMTIEQLVEEMEENEDEVECKWCGELFGRDDCRYEVDLGYLCSRCEAAIKSRGETLTFREGPDLDEEIELNEASLSDIAAAANSEFGTFYDDSYLLDVAGVDDDLRYVRNDSARTPVNTPSKIVDERAYIKKDAKKYSEAGRADLYNKKYVYFIRHFDDTPALDPETNELVYDEAKKKEIVDLVYATKKAAMEKSREAVKRAREKAAMKKKALEATVCEDITSERSFEELVKDSINHLVNDIGRDSSTEDFVDDVIIDIENNYEIKVPEEPMKYRDWCSAIACEVSRQLNNQLGEDFEVKEIYDLGNEYDGGYPTDKPLLPEFDDETSEVSGHQLALCPECGENGFDHETGICNNCGFNID